MTDTGLESLSFNLMNSATVVYAVAMVAWAYDFAFSSRVDRAVERVAEPVTVGAAGAGSVFAAEQDKRNAKLAERRSKAAGVAIALTILAFGLHAAAVAVRAYSAGRAPWGNMYEFSVSAALAVTAVFLVLLPKYGLRWLGLFVVTPVLVTLGIAVTLLYKPGTESLVPALDSYWLTIHVSAAVISSGIFTVSAAITLLYLLAERSERRVAAGQEPGFGGFVLARVPSAERLDQLAFRTIAFAFPIWTFAVVAGAIWAEDAWGRYWGWDPKETWAFITWVVYACYLHARVTVGWKGRRAAVIALIGFAAFLFNYFGVNILIPGLHSYSGL